MWEKSMPLLRDLVKTRRCKIRDHSNLQKLAFYCPQQDLHFIQNEQRENQNLLVPNTMSLLRDREHGGHGKFFPYFLLMKKKTFSPFPPKIIILEPAKIALCEYLGPGGVPLIFGF